MAQIHIFGDSNVAGWRPDAEKLFKDGISFASKLKQKYGNVVVQGTPGLTALNSGFSVLPATQILVLMIGVNDLGAGSGTQAVNSVQSILNMAGDCQKLYIIHPGIQFEKLHGMWLEMFGNAQNSQNEFLANVDNIRAEIVDLRGRDILGNDGLHLTKEGHQLVFELVDERLSKMLLK